jgi:hypothetical protein
VEAARWDNAMNGTYVSIHWNKVLWQVEESETPITAMRDMSQSAAPLDTYTMPTLEKDMAGRDQRVFMTVTTATIRQYAHISAGDMGPVVREKIIKGYEAVFDAVVQQWKEDGDTESLAKFEKLLPTLRRKLVWKKTAG